MNRRTLGILLFCFSMLSISCEEQKNDTFSEKEAAKDWILEYNDDGLPAGITLLENGLKDGPELKFFYSGALESIVTWQKGKREGKTIGFFENGGIWYQGTYHNDTIHNFFREHYPSGKPKQEFHYDMGVIVGKYLWYSEKGFLREWSLRCKLCLNKGVPLAGIKYDSLGMVIDEAEFEPARSSHYRKLLLDEGFPSSNPQADSIISTYFSLKGARP